MYNTLPVSYIFRLLHSSTYPLSARPVWRNTAPSWRTTTPSARKSRLSDAIEIFIEFFPRHDRHYVQTDGVRVQIYHLHRYRWVPDGHHRIPVHCGSGDSDSVSELPPTVGLPPWSVSGRCEKRVRVQRCAASSARGPSQRRQTTTTSGSRRQLPSLPVSMLSHQSQERVFAKQRETLLPPQAQRSIINEPNNTFCWYFCKWGGVSIQRPSNRRRYGTPTDSRKIVLLDVLSKL